MLQIYLDDFMIARAFADIQAIQNNKMEKDHRSFVFNT